MNQFINEYGDSLRRFWDKATTESEKEKLHTNILAYANNNPHQFTTELKEVLFDTDLDPLSVVLEALSKDTDTWGDFFVEILGKIFNAAYATDKADEILFNLTEFYYVEDDTRPFVQKIVNKLQTELSSTRTDIRLAAIRNIISFLNNPSIRNKTAIINQLTGMLNDPDWKVRYVTFQYLGFENLLPNGAKLGLADRLKKMIFGQP
ncbi:hypothetical protein AAFN85_03770 [Mucilaginibacter sp. CAU 1740]|uniref:hypothetical protein n=1 Tax=Mucilaginibacter sp. CAU 1740 TaxID=3140365 RepID=UPI00325B2AFC